MTFILLALVVYRLSRLIAIDDGPWDVFLKFRAKLGGYNLGVHGHPLTSLGRGVICPHCIGVWVALIISIIFYHDDSMGLIYWLALAGAQSFLQSLSRE